MSALRPPFQAELLGSRLRSPSRSGSRPAGGSAWVGWNADWADVLPADDVPEGATVVRAEPHDEM